MRRAKKQDFYSYPLSFSNSDLAGLASGEQQTLAIQVQANHAFMWTHAVAYVTQKGGAGDGLPFLSYFGAMTGGSLIPSWPLMVKIVDGGSQLGLQDNELPLSTLFGNGNQGTTFELPHPRLFKPNTTIQVTVRRFAQGQVNQAGAATANDLQADLVFMGVRLFDAESMHLTG